MKKLLDLITEDVALAFEKLDLDKTHARVSVSNRPDLCEFQCNGAMALAKIMRCAPIEIAGKIADELSSHDMYAEAVSCPPGFVNLKLSPKFISEYISSMASDEEHRYGQDKVNKTRTIIVDYGGPNVAKPLHVGHLRSAIIGESIKRMGVFMGNTMIGDVHLGDWGLQMGLIIAELKNRKPTLPYFSSAFMGEYPAEAPFTISELEEIYPAASAKSKEDEKFKEKAMQATYELQHYDKGYTALWNHIIKVSVNDLKRNYKRLNVSFELWKGESDAQSFIPEMVRKMRDEGYAHESDGALVVDVKEETDTKEIPPCMILKSDGASLYNTTDLATIQMRTEYYSPKEIIYVVDKRQELYFTQVFRCAKKTGICSQDLDLKFLGFGTMNGKDGKPFKTREGGVMRLEMLLNDTEEHMYERIKANGDLSDDEAKEIAAKVALAAIKYGDLSNQASKDYIFDLERFSSSEGNTGPYILYTIVRIKSILAKYGKVDESAAILPAANDSEKALALQMSMFVGTIASAFEELAPHRICAYVYDLCNAINKFYHEVKILAEEDEDRKKSYIAELNLARGILELCIDILGFDAPERM